MGRPERSDYASAAIFMLCKIFGAAATAVSNPRKICGTKRQPSPAFAKFAERKNGRFQPSQNLRNKKTAVSSFRKKCGTKRRPFPASAKNAGQIVSPAQAQNCGVCFALSAE